MTGQLRLVTVGVGAAVAALAVYNAIKWWKKHRIPTKWHKVGELVDIMCFPVKSLGVIRLKHTDCETLGVQSGFLRDRVFMVVDKNRTFITARAQPEMILISPSLEDGILTLKADGKQEPISINVKKLQNEARVKARVWGETVEVVDCGDEVAQWLELIIHNGSEIRPRLMFYPNKYGTRDVRGKNRIFHKLQARDGGAFPDVTSFNMISEASVDNLNTRLKKKVTPQNFRPNFVVRGSTAYEEDTWEWVRIGDVVFENVKPCTRCLLTTIDPETGIKSKDVEPLKTLKSFRQITDPKIRPHVGESPVMGIHLALRVPGSVKLGDPIYINQA